jgi:hypothetical protein
MGFPYALIVALAGGACLLWGFWSRDKRLVIVSLLAPCALGSPIVTFTRGAAGGIVAADVMSLFLLVAMLMGWHRRWRLVGVSATYRAATLFFAFGVMGVLFVVPLYVQYGLDASQTAHVSTTSVLGVPLYVLMAGFSLMKLTSFAVYGYFFGQTRFTKSDLNAVFVGVILAAAILTSATAVQHIGGIDLRLTGPETDSTSKAMIFVLGHNRTVQGRLAMLGAILSLLFARRNPLWLFAVLLFSGGILVSMSRGAFVGLLVLGIVWLREGIRGWILALLFVTATLGVVGWASVYRPDSLARFNNVAFELGRGTGSRPYIWINTIKYWEAEPIVLTTGVGPMNFYYGVPDRYRVAEHAHNDLLTCVTEMGIIGTLFWLNFLFVTWRSLSRRSSEMALEDVWVCTSMLSMILCCGVAGIFEETLYWANYMLQFDRVVIACLFSVCTWLTFRADEKEEEAE